MPTTSPRILIADDQRDVLEALRLLLKGRGYQIDTVESPAAALTALSQRDYDVVLIDLNYARDTTSGEEGLDLLDRLQEWNTGIPVVVMTAWSTVEIAVQAMQRGARDFVTKPWDNQRLIALIEKHVERAREARQAHQREKSERELARIRNRAATEAAFAKAAKVVKRSYPVSRVHAQFMEPRGGLGEWHAGEQRYTLHCDVQYPHRTRETVAMALGVPETSVRVISGDVGGAFGAKGWAHIEIVAKVGDVSDGTWSCEVTTHGREPQRFDGLKFVAPQMKRLTWLGFISPGLEPARAWLDEIRIENDP